MNPFYGMVILRKDMHPFYIKVNYGIYFITGTTFRSMGDIAAYKYKIGTGDQVRRM